MESELCNKGKVGFHGSMCEFNGILTPRWIHSIINYIKWVIFMCQTLGEGQQINLIFHLYKVNDLHLCTAFNGRITFLWSIS